MPGKYNFNCRPTMIGSLPLTDAELACTRVNRYLRDFPAWPQLPRRTHLENMYVQFSEGFPGIVNQGQKLTADLDDRFHAGLEGLYQDYADNNFQKYAVSRDHASGLHALVNESKRAAPALKGQSIGPISWGLCVTDSSGRGILYDETLADALTKFLRLKAAWQENLLRTVARDTIIFLDEPYLSSLGSAFVAISADEVAVHLREVLDGLQGIKGIHCCGGTDWKLLLGLPIDILSFDAYNYADSLACYRADVIDFLGRGGGIAWGIVPNSEETLLRETSRSLLDRLGEAMSIYTRDGLPFGQLVASSLVTPSCGLDSLSPDAAEEALKMLNDLSELINRKYVH